MSLYTPHLSLKLQKRMQVQALSFMQAGVDKYYKLWFNGIKPVFY